MNYHPLLQRQLENLDLPKSPGCVFQSKPATHSTGSLPPIPGKLATL